MEVVNVTDCVVMNNMGPSVRKKEKKRQPSKRTTVLFSSGDTSCSDPVPMVTMPGLTESFIKIADFFEKVSRKDCGQMCNNSAEVK